MARLTFRRWLFNIAVALDTLLNAIRGGKKHEPISKRLARARDRGKWWGCWGCRILDRLQKGHCDDALKWDA